MSQNFLHNLKNLKHPKTGEARPFFVQAPMADVTDSSFRQMFVKYGSPDVLYTEFVSCDGLMSEGRERLMPDFIYNKGIERPLVAQLFGGKPENFYHCAQLAVELGFDAIDINMGCPDSSVNRQMAGAALIQEPELAKAIVKETKRGAGDLPVLVKTRIGYNKIQTEEWTKHLIETEPAVLTFHGRTKKEMSKVPAHWDEIAKASKLIRESGIDCLVVGNGDVKSLEDGISKAKEFDVDGIMVGRGLFGNPWFFNYEQNVKEVPLDEKLKALIEHTHLFCKLFGGVKPFVLMRKHYSSYVLGYPNIKKLRSELVQTNNAEEVEKLVTEYLNEHGDSLKEVFPLN